MENHADVLVIFGITGDLARRMTFRALYRLESRGLLDGRPSLPVRVLGTRRGGGPGQD
jgi:glucose-6-phosphate 1-dehydrogenase